MSPIAGLENGLEGGMEYGMDYGIFRSKAFFHRNTWLCYL